jgi:HEPN domain-containing protein
MRKLDSNFRRAISTGEAILQEKKSTAKIAKYAKNEERYENFAFLASFAVDLLLNLLILFKRGRKCFGA